MENDRIPLLAPAAGGFNAKQAPLWKIILIVFGGCLITITCGSTNAFGAAYADQMTNDLGLSDVKKNVIAGLGLLGLYFALPAGYVLQRFGPFTLGFVGLVMATIGYGILPFITPSTFPLGVFLFCLVGFGLGGCFMAALGVSISISPTGGGWAMSVVSSGMSLSVAFHLYILGIYKDKSQCHLDECWRSYVRFFLIVLLSLCTFGVMLLFLYKKEDYPHLLKEEAPTKSIQEEDDFEPLNSYEEKQTKSDSLLRSFRAFKSPFFLSLFLGFFVGIGSSVYILTQTKGLWEDYLANKQIGTKPSIGDNIITMFSFFNAGSNLLTGIISDWLARKNILKYSSFLAIFQFLFAFVFVAVALLNKYLEYTAAFPVLLAFIGFSFGCYLVVFPAVIAETYGSQNFGQYFAHLQISSSIASVTVPIIAGTIRTKVGTYEYLNFGIAGLLFFSSVCMFVGRSFQNN